MHRTCWVERSKMSFASATVLNTMLPSTCFSKERKKKSKKVGILINPLLPLFYIWLVLFNLSFCCSHLFCNNLMPPTWELAPKAVYHDVPNSQDSYIMVVEMHISSHFLLHISQNLGNLRMLVFDIWMLKSSSSQFELLCGRLVAVVNENTYVILQNEQYVNKS